jgi:tRNA A-37 threonylcarbamoyl transferase component Bud32
MSESAPAPAPATPPDPLIGRRLGHCRIIDKIGEGGMGTVYRGRHEVLEKDVAIKVLAPAVRRDPDLVQRMLREARLAARIDHPGIVSVQDAGTEGGIPYLVMPYIRGKNLDDILKDRKRLKPSEAISAVKKAARAFAAAHKVGIIHRDVKPANLIVTTDGLVKVTDFGLALALTAGDPRLTKADSVVGTPQFMAPEQVSGESLDVRTDVYSLGATLYNLVAGEAPYAGGTPLSVAIKHADPEARPRPLRELVPDLPDDIVALVERMMAKKPEDRFQDMESVIRAIESIQGVTRGLGPPSVETPIPGPSRRGLWIGIGVGVALAVAAGIALLAIVGRGASARNELHEADRFAATASTPAQLAEAAQRYESIAKKFPGSREAALAEGLRQDLQKRASAAVETEALKALEEAERFADGASASPQRKEAARRFADVAQRFAGTRTATIAEARRKEMEGSPAEGREFEAFKALRHAHTIAVKAQTPAQLKEAAAQYRQVAERFPGTLAAQRAAEEAQRYERQAGAEPPKEIPASELPAAQRALDARCRAFLDLLRRDVRHAKPPEMQEHIRKLAQFVVPDESRTPLERAGVHAFLGVIVGGFAKQGWVLQGYTIDKIEINPKKRDATVSLRLQLKHDTQGAKENPQTQHWALSGTEWYLVPEDKDRRPGPPRTPGSPRPSPGSGTR